MFCRPSLNAGPAFSSMEKPESQRIRFELYGPADKDAFTALVTDERVMKYVGDGRLSHNEAVALWKKLTEVLYPDGKMTIWALFSKDDGRYLGHASIRPRPDFPEEWEIGYILKSREWGKGFATEAAKTLVDFGFDRLGLEEVFATVDDDHESSIRVLTKAGLKFARYDHDESGRYSVYSTSARSPDRR